MLLDIHPTAVRWFPASDASVPNVSFPPPSPNPISLLLLNGRVAFVIWGSQQFDSSCRHHLTGEVRRKSMPRDWSLEYRYSCLRANIFCVSTCAKERLYVLSNSPVKRDTVLLA